MTSEFNFSELLRRPILVGGLGLTAGAWLLHGLDPSITHLGSTALWSAVAAGSGFWWWKQQQGGEKSSPSLPLPVMDRALIDRAFGQVEARIEQLYQELRLATPTGNASGEATEAAIEPVVVQTLRQQLADLKAQTDRKAVRLAVLGGSAVGKTTLIQWLQGQEAQPLGAAEFAFEPLLEPSFEPLQSVVEVSLNPADDADRALGSAAGSSADRATTNPTIDPTIAEADLVLFVTTGDLTDTEYQTIQYLVQNYYRVMLVFNKQDQYLPPDRPVILQRLRERVQDWIATEDVVAIAAQPAPVKVRQQQADGSMQDRIEQPQADWVALQDRLGQVLAQQTDSLALATVFRQSQALLTQVQTELNQVRRTRALPIIEQYQWIAAAAAFANPVPSLDLLATATINTQMVIDLGAIYQQPFSLEQAKTVTGNLGSQMVKLGLVEMASQAISPLLKSHALTYVAGGTLQGLSAAYLTRLAGLSLVEYFEENSQSADAAASFQPERLVQKLKSVFQDNQRTVFVQTLVKQGMERLLPQSSAVGVAS